MALSLFAMATLMGATSHALLDGPPLTSAPPAVFLDANPRPTAPAELRQRAAETDTLFLAPDHTCGFVNGLSNSAYTCNDPSATCAISSLGSNGYLGCCVDGVCGGWSTTCIELEQIEGGACKESDCNSDSLTLLCAAPFCNGVSINAVGSKIYGFYCSSVTNPVTLALLTTSSGEADGRHFTTSLYVPTTISSFPGPSSFTGPSTTHPITTSPVPPPPTPAPTPHPKPIGAIVGGTVGGVAGLALIGIILFLVLRRRSKSAQPQIAPAVAGQMSGPQQPGVQPLPPPGSYQPTFAPGQPGQPPYRQQPYYPSCVPAGAVGMMNAPTPDRTDSTSPMLYGGGNVSPMPSQSEYNRMSTVSAAGSTTTSQLYGPAAAISPQTTGSSHVAGAGGPGMQVPPTIHEAGSTAVGQDGENHHGQLHEMG